MWVEMMLTISGGRADGREWPDAGYLIEIPEDEAQDLIRARIAVRADPPREPDVPVVPVPSGPPVEAIVSEPSATGAGPVPEAVPEPVPEPEPVTPVAEEDSGDPPKPADPKADWVTYAVAHGANPSDAEASTKVQLMQAYGGRL
jgi:hypothetical protein